MGALDTGTVKIIERDQTVRENIRASLGGLQRELQVQPGEETETIREVDWTVDKVRALVATRPSLPVLKGLMQEMVDAEHILPTSESEIEPPPMFERVVPVERYEAQDEVGRAALELLKREFRVRGSRPSRR
jgi:hypothetical protein